MSDPLRAARRREVAIVGAGGAALAVAAAWAARPLAPAQLAAPDLRWQFAAEAAQSTEAKFDAGAFEARIWNPRPNPAPPPIVKAAPAQSPAPPLRLQLIAIVRQEQQLVAALYDPEDDRLRIVRSGDMVGLHRVALVDALGVELQSGAGPSRRINLIVPGEGP